MIEIWVTVQQKKVLDKYFEGTPLTDIAVDLNISYSRVIQILNNILIKTKLQTRKELLIKRYEICYNLK